MRRYYTRGVCIYIYICIWRVGGKNIRKKLRPRLWRASNGRKNPWREREREMGELKY